MADYPSGLPSPFDESGHTHVQRGTGDPSETKGFDGGLVVSMPPKSGSFPPTRGPQKLGKYELLAEIGEGGMGRVYKAFDPVLKRHVAIKVLRPSTNVDDIVRFRGEASLVAALEHPNIVQIYEIDNDAEQRPYIVLEYVDGGGLDAKLRKQLPRPREAAEWAETLALAVQNAHDKGIIHRDLKPANVLVTRAGVLKVSDFGLGKRLDESSGRTQTGDVFGTPGYMAPEQASGKVKQFGPPTDVYALGAMLYEFLTGRPPFSGAKVWDILGQVRYADPVSPSVVARGIPRDLNTICLKCLEKAPARRYQTATALADDLRRFLDGMPIQASPVPWWGKVWRRVKRRPKEAAIVAVMTSAVLVIGGLLLHLREQDREAAQREQTDRLEKDKESGLRALAEEHREKWRKKNAEALAALKNIRGTVLRDDLAQRTVQSHLKEQLANYFSNVVFTDEDFSSEDPAELFGRAAECQLTGQLFGEGGQSARAAQLYDKAADLYEKAADKGGGPKAVHARAVCLRETGRYQTAAGNLVAAEQNLTDAERLLNPGGGLDAAEVHQRKGELYSQQELFQKADDAFSAAVQLLEKLPADPRPAADAVRLQALARGHGWRGDVRLELGFDIETSADADYWTSDRYRTEVVRLLAGVPPEQLTRERLEKADDAVFEAVFQLCNGWGNHASFAIRKRMFGVAEHFIGRQMGLLRLITDLRPTRSEYRALLAGRQLTLAEMELAAGNFQPSPARCEKAAGLATTAAKMFEDVANANAETSLTRSNWARCLLVLARVELLRKGNPLPYLERAAAKLGEQKHERMADLYSRAVIHGLRARHLPAAAEVESEAALKLLHQVYFDKPYREVHRETVRCDVAFQGLRDRKEWSEALELALSKTKQVLSGTN